MKTITLTILALAAVLDAKPFFGFRKFGIRGLRSGYGNSVISLGNVGVGTGVYTPYIPYGCGASFQARPVVRPMGLIILGLCPGLAQSGGFGNNLYSFGNSGLGSQVSYSNGGTNFHNVGQQQNSLTSINHAENIENHDVGGSEFFNTAAQSGTGFNQFGNGLNQVGTSFNQIGNGLNHFSNRPNQLSNGPNQFNTGLNQVGNGLNHFSNGPNQLNNCQNQFNTGLNQVGNGLNQFSNGPNQLNNCQNQFNTGLNQVGNGLNQFSNGPNQVSTGLNQVGEGLNHFSNGPNQVSNGLNQLSNGCGSVQEITCLN